MPMQATVIPKPNTDASQRAGARSVFRDQHEQVAAGTFGLWALLATLAMLFGGLVLALLAVRLGSDDWPTSLPHLPWQVWVSTAAIIGCSVAFAEAVAADRRGSDTGVRAAMATALVGAVVFTGMQTWAWFSWYDTMGAWEASAQTHRMAIMGFWVLTGLHVAHVLGGLVPLAMLAWYAVARRWTTSRRGFLGHAAIYWHFLDVVWVLLVVTMLVVL